MQANKRSRFTGGFALYKNKPFHYMEASVSAINNMCNVYAALN